jgi:hypothetical protein
MSMILPSVGCGCGLPSPTAAALVFGGLMSSPPETQASRFQSGNRESVVVDIIST